MSKNVLMVLAHDPFRDPEYFEPKRILISAGHIVTTTSTQPVAKGAEGAQVTVDVLFNNVNPNDYDSIVFIGGAGSKEYYDNPKAHQIARDMVASGKVLGAICAAVGTISNAGVLKNKKATSFSGIADMVRAGGAIYTGAPIAVDGNIVTADGPRSSRAFGEELKSLLK